VQSLPLQEAEIGGKLALMDVDCPDDNGEELLENQPITLQRIDLGYLKVSLRCSTFSIHIHRLCFTLTGPLTSITLELSQLVKKM